MNLKPCLLAIGVSAAWWLGCGNRPELRTTNDTTMPTPNRNLRLTVINLSDTPLVRSIRVRETPAGVRLVSATFAATPEALRNLTTISASRLEGVQTAAPAVLFSIGQLLPAPPSWDVHCTMPDGAFRCVLERPGGAMNALVLLDQQGNCTTITVANPLESFSRPRFVRRETAGRRPSISAIADDRFLVVFSGTSAGGNGAYTRVGEWTDGLLVATAKGYVAFAKRATGGPAREGILPGTLECIRLDERFRVVAEPFQPLGTNVLVYEFDADRLPDDRLHEQFAVLATGPDQTVLAIGTAMDSAFTRVALLGGVEPLMTTRPTVAWTDKGLAVACLEKALSPSARVWAGVLSEP